MMPSAPVRSSRVSPAVRYAWFLLGGLVTLAVLAGGVVTIWQVAEGNLASRQQQQSTISSEGVPETLSIAGSSANVELIGAEADAVTADLDLIWYMSEPVVDSERQGSEQVVDLYCRYNGVPVWFVPDCGIDYSAQVPEPSSVAVELTSGSILARGLADGVDLAATSGSITGEDLSGTIQVSTSSGMISMELSEGPSDLTAETEFGDISIGVSREESYRIITSTTDGRIDVGVPSDPEAESVLDLRSTYGDITVTYFD